MAAATGAAWVADPPAGLDWPQRFAPLHQQTLETAMHADTYPDLKLAHPTSGVVTIQINRPDFRNALNIAVRTQLAMAFTEVAQSPDARAIVLSGTGGSFCGGADLNEMA